MSELNLFARFTVPMNLGGSMEPPSKVAFYGRKSDKFINVD